MVKMTTTEATYYEDGNQIEYFVGETIADRRFENMTFEQAKTFCEDKDIELFVQLENGDEISAEQYDSKIYFRIIASEETADGFVHQGQVLYKDPLFETYMAHSISSQEIDGIFKAYDLYDQIHIWTDGYDENEFGIYVFEKFSIIINPQGINEHLLNTIIRKGEGYDDCAWNGALPKCSISDVLDSIGAIWNHYTKISPCMAYVRCMVEGEVNHRLMKINYGDSEIADAVESAIRRMNEVTFVDKTGDD